MAGTVLSVFNWSIFQWSSVVLIGLWAFNPLGSQASFRGIYLTDSLSHGVGQISHFDYNLTTQKSLASIFEVGYTDTGPTFRALYSAAVYGATSNVQYVGKGNATFEKAIIALGGSEAAGVQAATDSWGNIRVPNVEYLADFDPVHPTEWISTPWRKQLQNYSSLVGDRFDGLDRSFVGNTTFNLTSSYQSLNVGQLPRLNITALADPLDLVLAMDEVRLCAKGSVGDAQLRSKLFFRYELRHICSGSDTWEICYRHAIICWLGIHYSASLFEPLDSGFSAIHFFVTRQHCVRHELRD